MNYITLNKAKLIASHRLMEDYIKNGGAYMANHKLLNLDEKRGRIVNSSSKKATGRSIEDTKQYIKDTMVAIRSKHEPYMPKVNWTKYEDELRKKEYIAPTQSEIQKSAEDKYADYKKASIDKIMLDYDVDKNTLDKASDELTQNYSQDKRNLTHEKIGEMEDNQQRAISQGIQDSSILDNQQISAITQYEESSAMLDNQYEIEWNAIEMKKNLVESQKELALENFDIAYANKLNTEIRKLTNEQNKIKAEVDKYNTQIDKRKQEIQEEFDKANADRIAEINDDIQRDIVSETFEILKTMPRSEAMRVLKDPEIAEAMGDWLSVLSIWLRDY